MGANVFYDSRSKKDFLFLNVNVALNLLVGRAVIKPKHGDKRDQDGLHSAQAAARHVFIWLRLNRFILCDFREQILQLSRRMACNLAF